MRPPAPAPRTRLADAARLLPLLCLALLVLPAVLLPGAAPQASPGWLAWLFGAWAGVIAGAALLARRVSRDRAAAGGEGDGSEGAEP